MLTLISLLLVLLTPIAQSAGLESIQFGIATAPGQAEDQLDDIWLDWGKAGKIAGFKETPFADRRLDLWSNPETEMDLVAKSGVQIYRLGLDWGRIMPGPGQFDSEAIAQYHLLLNKIKARHLKIMISIMHHSVPKWAQARGGWLDDRIKQDFLDFSKRIIDEFHGKVDYWVTFNEGNIFAFLAYSQGLWPPGETRPITSILYFGPFKGATLQAMDRMAESHNQVYEWAHTHYPKIQMGLAHNMAHYTGKTWFNRFKSKFSDEIMNWRFPERVRDHLDFFGFNYYGAEWLKGDQIDIDPEEEYSEAGRAIDPEGLYQLLKEIDQRFHLPIFITENGIADETDWIRPAYLIEHLKAVELALAEGVPVKTYFVWTLSDNLEWSDGYCPKFGLVSVDRKSNLKHTPRPSYFLFQKIVHDKVISESMRNEAWSTVVSHQGMNRPFCRSSDGITALATPSLRKIVIKDWRFRPQSAGASK
jgi:beta-glucosidase/6-phospho-beta-glucosidase/beta-galactosidase